jgi:hypothetical protein
MCSPSLRFAVPILSLSLSQACADPGAKFDEFVARSANPPADGGAGGPDAAPSTSQTLPDPQSLSGSYLSVTSFTVSPLTPILNRLELTATRSGDDYVLSMRFQPLAFADRKTPAGPLSEPYVVLVRPDGSYESAALRFDTPGKANPMLMVDSLTDLVLRGTLGQRQEGADDQVRFLCGTFSGQLITPLAQELAGTFAYLRVEEGEDYPEPAIDCDMNPAGPL